LFLCSFFLSFQSLSPYLDLLPSLLFCYFFLQQSTKKNCSHPLSLRFFVSSSTRWPQFRSFSLFWRLVFLIAEEMRRNRRRVFFLSILLFFLLG
ncbi:unnamed protein product, partial [Linum tenue]